MRGSRRVSLPAMMSSPTTQLGKRAMPKSDSAAKRNASKSSQRIRHAQRQIVWCCYQVDLTSQARLCRAFCLLAYEQQAPTRSPDCQNGISSGRLPPIWVRLAASLVAIKERSASSPTRMTTSSRSVTGSAIRSVKSSSVCNLSRALISRGDNRLQSIFDAHFFEKLG